MPTWVEWHAGCSLGVKTNATAKNHRSSSISIDDILSLDIEFDRIMPTLTEDYYALLGVSKNASPDELQKAYRTLARKYHPDLNPDDKAAQQKFKDIQKAYDVLNEPEKRKMYDQFGPEFERMGAGGPFPGGGGAGQGGFSFEDIFGGASGAGGPGGGFQFDGDLGDIFRQFGGGQGDPRRGRGRGRAAQQPAKGVDLTAELTIPFATAVLGGEASISVRREGNQDAIQVKIPAGVESGKKMRLRGQGEPGPGRAPAGDLLVTLSVAPHPCFKRIGNNLELRLPITFAEAALGATVDVPTPGGTVSLKIPPGSNSGRRLRVKGQGVQAKSAGDLYVELQIKLPEQLGQEIDEKTREAIERIDQLYNGSVREELIW